MPWILITAKMQFYFPGKHKPYRCISKQNSCGRLPFVAAKNIGRDFSYGDSSAGTELDNEIRKYASNECKWKKQFDLRFFLTNSFNIAGRLPENTRNSFIDLDLQSQKTKRQTKKIVFSLAADIFINIVIGLRTI